MFIEMTTRTSFPVLHTEVDGMGVVHHSNYLLWFEKGRKDYLKKSGISSSKIVNHGFFLPISELECRFKSPARYGDEIIVITKILSMSCVKIKFEYTVINKSKGKLLASGKTIHVWTNHKIEPVNIIITAPEIYWQLKKFSESQDIT